MKKYIIFFNLLTLLCTHNISAREDSSQLSLPTKILCATGLSCLGCSACYANQMCAPVIIASTCPGNPGAPIVVRTCLCVSEITAALVLASNRFPLKDASISTQPTALSNHKKNN